MTGPPPETIYVGEGQSDGSDTIFAYPEAEHFARLDQVVRIHEYRLVRVLDVDCQITLNEVEPK